MLPKNAWISASVFGKAIVAKLRLAALATLNFQNLSMNIYACVKIYILVSKSSGFKIKSLFQKVFLTKKQEWGIFVYRVK